MVRWIACVAWFAESCHKCLLPQARECALFTSDVNGLIIRGDNSL